MTAITLKEIYAHLLNLKVLAEMDNKEEFTKLARKILIPRSPELTELYTFTKEAGYSKKDQLKKNFNRKAEAMEELIRVAYPCFQSCNFTSLFEHLRKMGM